MSGRQVKDWLAGELIDETGLSLGELCQVCGVSAEDVLGLVREGVIEPLDAHPARWRFEGGSLRRIRCAIRLQRDLGVNQAGAALALDLLDELSRLRARLERFGD